MVLETQPALRYRRAVTCSAEPCGAEAAARESVGVAAVAEPSAVPMRGGAARRQRREVLRVQRTRVSPRALCCIVMHCAASSLLCLLERELLSCVARRYGNLPWGGIAGIEPILKEIRRFNNMGHPLLRNIREVGTALLPRLLVLVQCCDRGLRCRGCGARTAGPLADGVPVRPPGVRRRARGRAAVDDCTLRGGEDAVRGPQTQGLRRYRVCAVLRGCVTATLAARNIVVASLHPPLWWCACMDVYCAHVSLCVLLCVC